ncbi:hypothetical protein L484_016214 [Morus notabilis]|uniref:Uncharacterized protein n=1 Tax=Morus notabilis TaxID=981085 RepID=W9S293_9ROSA|nr:hypothetical protein L484_016214 [Morus notabilis]
MTAIHVEALQRIIFPMQHRLGFLVAQAYPLQRVCSFPVLGQKIYCSGWFSRCSGFRNLRRIFAFYMAESVFSVCMIVVVLSLIFPTLLRSSHLDFR